MSIELIVAIIIGGLGAGASVVAILAFMASKRQMAVCEGEEKASLKTLITTVENNTEAMKAIETLMREIDVRLSIIEEWKRCHERSPNVTN